MSCFCIANIDLLASLDVDLQASLTLSASAQAALTLHERLSLGLPGLPGPPFGLPELDISVEALASLIAIAQLQAQAKASLGIDLAAKAGVTALARLTATLNARLSAMVDLNLNLDAWIQLARLNAATLGLTAVFRACLAVRVRAELDASVTANLDFVVAPPNWGGSQLVLLSSLVDLSAQLGVRLDAAFVASLKATARLVAEATVNISLDVSAAATLTAGFSAIAKLGVTLGINPLEAGFAAVRVAVAANYTEMVSLAEQLDIDFSEGVTGLPSLLSIPGLRAAVVASLRARLEAAVRASAAFDAEASVEVSAYLQAQVSADVDLSMAAVIAASLSVSLSAMLGISVALPAPCGVCDLRAIMAELAAMVAALADLPDSPGGLQAGRPPTVPGMPNTPIPAVSNGAPPGVGGAPPAPGAAGTGNAAAGDSAAATAGGGTGGGAGGGGGGGGVPATVMTAQLKCTMGMAPAPLTVLPVNKTMVGSQVAANIMDHVPMMNIMPFGMCMSPANPTVAAATAAALGVLTPMACIPATSAPWLPGAPTVLLGGKPMLTGTSKCLCNWAGVISILFPGQVQTTIP